MKPTSTPRTQSSALSLSSAPPALYVGDAVGSAGASPSGTSAAGASTVGASTVGSTGASAGGASAGGASVAGASTGTSAATGRSGGAGGGGGTGRPPAGAFGRGGGGMAMPSNLSNDGIRFDACAADAIKESEGEAGSAVGTMSLRNGESAAASTNDNQRSGGVSALS